MGSCTSAGMVRLAFTASLFTAACSAPDESRDRPIAPPLAAPVSADFALYASRAMVLGAGARVEASGRGGDVGVERALAVAPAADLVAGVGATLPLDRTTFAGSVSLAPRAELGFVRADRLLTAPDASWWPAGAFPAALLPSLPSPARVVPGALPLHVGAQEIAMIASAELGHVRLDEGATLSVPLVSGPAGSGTGRPESG